MRKAGGSRFVKELFASTEMFIDQLLELARAGVLRRRVYDSLPLERLLASGEITERIDEGMLEALVARRCVRRSSPQTTFRRAAEVRCIPRATWSSRTDACVRPTARWIEADLSSPTARAADRARMSGT